MEYTTNDINGNPIVVGSIIISPWGNLVKVTKLLPAGGFVVEPIDNETKEVNNVQA